MLSALGGCTIFSSLDLRSAYHQIALEENSKKYTAFTVNFQKYEFNRLPFGYVNAPSVFQAVMCKVLNRLLGKLCFVFIDDILISKLFSKIRACVQQNSHSPIQFTKKRYAIRLELRMRGQFQRIKKLSDKRDSFSTSKL